MSIAPHLILPLFWDAILLIVLGTTIGLSRFYFVGTKKFSYKTLTPGAPQGPKWYSSINRAYINGIEAIAIFAPAFIIHLVLPGADKAIILEIAWLFLIGRLVYTLIYVSLGYNILCSFAWLVGFAATILAWITLVI